MHRNTHDARVFQHCWLTKVLLTVPAALVGANLSSWICFQADLLLLSTSEPHGLCYIETAELDGSDNAARFIPDAQYLTIYRSSGARPLKSCVFVLSCRETNMKVRQSVSVTSDLGDQNNLASFDGEVSSQTSPCFFGLVFGTSYFMTI